MYDHVDDMVKIFFIYHHLLLYNLLFMCNLDEICIYNAQLYSFFLYIKIVVFYFEREREIYIWFISISFHQKRKTRESVRESVYTDKKN